MRYHAIAQPKGRAIPASMAARGVNCYVGKAQLSSGVSPEAGRRSRWPAFVRRRLGTPVAQQSRCVGSDALQRRFARSPHQNIARHPLAGFKPQDL